MKENNCYDTGNDRYYITAEPNSNSLKSVLEISPGYQVDLTTPNSIRTVLDFNAQSYTEGYHESENFVNIMNVSSLMVTNEVMM